MDKQQLLNELELNPAFTDFLVFIAERGQSHLSEAIASAKSGKSGEAASHLVQYDELKSLWSNFKSSYEN